MRATTSAPTGLGACRRWSSVTGEVSALTVTTSRSDAETRAPWTAGRASASTRRSAPDVDRVTSVCVSTHETTARASVRTVKKTRVFFKKKAQPSGFFGFYLGFLDKQEKIGKIIQKLSNLKP